MTRQFTSSPAKRARVPLFIGIAGPSSSGKTYSALRLASGIARTAPGKVFVVDTEAGRSKHYADQFEFEHVPFEPPFNPLSYLDAIRHCVNGGASVIVIDSASHLHEGEGGLLDMHEQEMDRMAGAGADYKRREQMKWAAWIKPKQEMKRFIQCLLQLQTNIVFCFRARDKVKPVRGGDPVEMGFSAIAGDDLIYEMTAQALLLPGAHGVPTWQPKGGKNEQLQTKLPGQFSELLKQSGPLSEDMGELMGRWAMGAVLTGGAAPAAKRPPSAAVAPPAGGGAPQSGSSPESVLERVRSSSSAAEVEALSGELRTISVGWDEGQKRTVREAFRVRRQELAGG